MCTVTLKDRFKTQYSEDREWYERAFGNKRNIMKIDLSFMPPPEGLAELQFFAKINYAMFPEMKEQEFQQDEDYYLYSLNNMNEIAPDMDPKKPLTLQDYIPLTGSIGDNGVTEYNLELDLPYGEFTPHIFLLEANKNDSSEGAGEPQPIPQQFMDFFSATCIPEPISREKQQQNDDMEEKENKEKEREARQAQKELEQRKARQKAEAQQQLLKQEQNSAKLKVYFSAMDLYFHKQEEDFNASMSLLSIYHLELHENFKYYASVCEPFYTRKENEMIPLQGFFHFVKLMNLTNSAEELISWFTQSLYEIDGMFSPVDDTLNIKGGMNYAQFLSAILKIGYLKAEQQTGQSNQAYKNALDEMFTNANIDIEKRKIQDPILTYVYSQDTQVAFLEYEHCLQAIFTGKGTKLGETFLQLDKHVFIQMLNEVGFLIHPKKQTPEEEKKQKEARENKAAGKPLTPE